MAALVPTAHLFYLDSAAKKRKSQLIVYVGPKLQTDSHLLLHNGTNTSKLPGSPSNSQNQQIEEDNEQRAKEVLEKGAKELKKMANVFKSLGPLTTGKPARTKQSTIRPTSRRSGFSTARSLRTHRKYPPDLRCSGYIYSPPAFPKYPARHESMIRKLSKLSTKPPSSHSTSSTKQEQHLQEQKSATEPKISFKVKTPPAAAPREPTNTPKPK